MSWQELRKQALQLSVSDRLALVEAMLTLCYRLSDPGKLRALRRLRVY